MGYSIVSLKASLNVQAIRPPVHPANLSVQPANRVPDDPASRARSGFASVLPARRVPARLIAILTPCARGGGWKPAPLARVPAASFRSRSIQTACFHAPGGDFTALTVKMLADRASTRLEETHLSVRWNGAVYVLLRPRRRQSRRRLGGTGRPCFHAPAGETLPRKTLSRQAKSPFKERTVPEGLEFPRLRAPTRRPRLLTFRRQATL